MTIKFCYRNYFRMKACIVSTELKKIPFRIITTIKFHHHSILFYCICTRESCCTTALTDVIGHLAKDLDERHW